MTALGIEGQRRLKPGDPVVVRAGQDAYCYEARATVTQLPQVSVMVRITEILHKGNKVSDDIAVGQEIVAGTNELYS